MAKTVNAISVPWRQIKWLIDFFSSVEAPTQEMQEVQRELQKLFDQYEGELTPLQEMVPAELAQQLLTEMEDTELNCSSVPTATFRDAVTIVKNLLSDQRRVSDAQEIWYAALCTTRTRFVVVFPKELLAAVLARTQPLSPRDVDQDALWRFLLEKDKEVWVPALVAQRIYRSWSEWYLLPGQKTEFIQQVTVALVRAMYPISAHITEQ